jgi:hypothetical protein
MMIVDSNLKNSIFWYFVIFPFDVIYNKQRLFMLKDIRNGMCGSQNNGPSLKMSMSQFLRAVTM